jgi:hypothetical protein
MSFTIRIFPTERFSVERTLALGAMSEYAPRSEMMKLYGVPVYIEETGDVRTQDAVRLRNEAYDTFRKDPTRAVMHGTAFEKPLTTAA